MRVTAGTELFFHSGLDENDLIKFRQFITILFKCLLDVLNTAVDERFFDSGEVLHLLCSKCFIFFHCCAGLLHLVIKIILREVTIVVILVGEHQLATFFSRCKTVRNMYVLFRSAGTKRTCYDSDYSYNRYNFFK